MAGTWRGGENIAVFNRSARWYDAFYAHVDYQAEAEQVTAIIHGLNPEAGRLLDVACGTGRHLAWFRRHFECAGTDIEPEMLEIARETLPGVSLEKADMIELYLGRRFDAVTCLFSSIGYTLVPDRLDRAVRAMVRHLHPGGVLVVEPWITPDAWIGTGTDTVDVVEQTGGTLVRIISSRRSGDETVLRMHYVHAAAGDIETENEQHRLGLFSRDRYLDAFASAGLTAGWLDPGLRGRGLVVGQARAE
jgi:ubiquinone/menaquinone biosynthesis C-methylase UbiE